MVNFVMFYSTIYLKKITSLVKFIEQLITSKYMEMPRHREVKYLGQFYTINEYRNSASTPSLMVKNLVSILEIQNILQTHFRAQTNPRFIISKVTE